MAKYVLLGEIHCPLNLNFSVFSCSFNLVCSCSCIITDVNLAGIDSGLAWGNVESGVEPYWLTNCKDKLNKLLMNYSCDRVRLPPELWAREFVT